MKARTQAIMDFVAIYIAAVWMGEMIRAMVPLGGGLYLPLNLIASLSLAWQWHKLRRRDSE